LVDVIWRGHACFELRGRSVVIVIDPFRGIGLPEPVAKADIVLCSHSHADHNNADPVKKRSGHVLEGFTGSRKIGDVSVVGIASFHDDVEGDRRGKNSIYVFSLDDVRFCHLGDLGHDLSSNDVDDIGKIEVLFVPVGGFFTIGSSLATSVSEKLNPKITIPMHYRMPGMSPRFNALSTVDDFIKGKANVKKVEGPLLTVTKDEMPKETTIVVLSLN